jgi:hypothetical protein
LQEQDATSSTGEGLPLETVTEIAREIGLDPAFVERAAAMLENRMRTRASFWGGPVTYESRVSAPERLSHGQLLELVDIVRSVTRHQGNVKEVLGSLEWKTVGEVNQIAVTVRAEEDETIVQILGNRGASSALTWICSIAGGFATGGIVGAIVEPATVLGGVGIMAACGAAGVAVARSLWAHTTRKFRRRFIDLSERLSSHIKRQRTTTSA